MSESSDMARNIREALDKIARSGRVVIVHPDRESAVRAIVEATPDAGMFEVRATAACPPDRIFVMPKPHKEVLDIGADQ